jgi:hypothetical protein
VLFFLPRHHNSLLAKCGCKKHAGLSRRPHQHVHSSLRWNQGARLDGVCPWPIIPDSRTQGPYPIWSHGASTGQRRGDVGIRNYLRDQADSRSLVFDLIITHDRYGRSSHPLQNGRLTHPQGIDAPLHIAAQRKMNSYRQQYADNQNISFLPAIMSTSTRMHGEFLRLLFLQAHRKTEAHPTATGEPSQCNQSDSFRFKRAAISQLLKSKVGLAAAKAAALRIDLNTPFFSPPKKGKGGTKNTIYCSIRVLHKTENG